MHRQTRAALADRLERYADAADRAVVAIPAAAAAITFVVVAGLVAVDIGPKVRIARALARRLRSK